jgi:hypothetical protein
VRDPDQLRLEIGIALNGERYDLQRAWRAEWRKALGAELPLRLERAIDRDGLEGPFWTAHSARRVCAVRSPRSTSKTAPRNAPVTERGPTFPRPKIE